MMTDSSNPLQDNESGNAKPDVLQGITAYREVHSPGAEFDGRIFTRVYAKPGERFTYPLDDIVGLSLPIRGLPCGDASAAGVVATIVDDGAAILLSYQVTEEVARTLASLGAQDYLVALVGGQLRFTPQPAVTA